jgi:hypothetical protein
MLCELCMLNIGRGAEGKLQHGVMLFLLTETMLDNKSPETVNSVVSRIPSFWGSGNWARGLGLSNTCEKSLKGMLFVTLISILELCQFRHCSCSISHVLVFYQYTFFNIGLQAQFDHSVSLMDGLQTLRLDPRNFRIYSTPFILPSSTLSFSSTEKACFLIFFLKIVKIPCSGIWGQ